MAIADITANAIRRASLHEETVRHAERLLKINAAGRVLAETLELPDIYRRLTEVVCQLLPDVYSVFVFIYNPESEQITCVCAYGDGEFIDPQEFPPLPLDPDAKGKHSQVIVRREPLVINNLTQEDRAHVSFLIDNPEHLARSAVYVPLLVQGKTVGLLQVQSSSLNRFGESEVELLGLVANTAAVAIENARLFAETERRLRFVSALHTIDTTIASSLDLHLILNIILDHTLAHVGVDAAAIYLLNPHLRELEFTAGRGFTHPPGYGTRLRISDEMVAPLIMERRMVHIPDLLTDDTTYSRKAMIYTEGFVVYAAHPLIVKGEVSGILEVFLRPYSGFSPDWNEYMQAMAGQAALAIDSSRMFTDLQRANIDLSLAYDATIEGWSKALDLRDEDTEGHTRRVADMTLHLARQMGVNDTDLVHIWRGSLLHDIGKMGVPDSILHKPGPLTESEWEVMRRHPVDAYELLSKIGYLNQALHIPYNHHEKWDGTGYPRGLRGQEIPLAARIFALADVWDALSSDRPYRKAWPVHKVMEYIRSQAGRHFDPGVVEVFLNMMNMDITASAE